MRLDADSAIVVVPGSTFMIDGINGQLCFPGLDLENESGENVWIGQIKGRLSIQIGGKKPTAHNGASENQK